MKRVLQTMLCWFPGNQTSQNSDNVAKLPYDPLNTGSTKLPTRHSFMRRLVLTCLLFSFTIAYAQTVTVNLTTGTSWTVPAGTYSITVQCWGAGGGGGRATSSGNCTGGGGGGAFAQINTISVNPGDVFAYSIGAGGVGNSTTQVIQVAILGSELLQPYLQKVVMVLHRTAELAALAAQQQLQLVTQNTMVVMVVLVPLVDAVQHLVEEAAALVVLEMVTTEETEVRADLLAQLQEETEETEVLQKL